MPPQKAIEIGIALGLAIGEWMEDYNEIHPHSQLGYRLPREYIRANVQPAACPV
jgi:transposase InsO family protein